MAAIYDHPNRKIEGPQNKKRGPVIEAPAQGGEPIPRRTGCVIGFTGHNDTPFLIWCQPLITFSGKLYNLYIKKNIKWGWFLVVRQMYKLYNFGGCDVQIG